MKKDGKGLILAMAAVALVLAIAVAGVTIMRTRAVRKYREWISLGQEYLAEQNYEQAILAFTEAIAIAPKSAAANGWLGDAYVGQAQSYDPDDVALIRASYDNAAAAYNQAITLAPDNEVLYAALTDTYTANAGLVAEENPEAAEAYLKQAEDLLVRIPEAADDGFLTDLTDRVDQARREIESPVADEETAEKNTAEEAEGPEEGDKLSPENQKAHEAFEERLRQLRDLLDACVSGRMDYVTVMEEHPDTPYLLWMMFSWDPNYAQYIRIAAMYRDLNGDGVDELIVGDLEKDDFPNPLAIYVYDGEGTRMIFDRGSIVRRSY